MIAERTNTGIGLRLLAAIALTLGTVGAGAAFAGDGGTEPGDPPPAPACVGGASGSGGGPNFDVVRRDADPGVDYPDDGNKPEFTYKISDVSQAVDIEVQVVKDNGSGDVVKSYCPDDVAPDVAQKVEWDNTTESGSKAPKGKYKFRIRKRDGSKPNVDAPAHHRFQWRGHFFPVRGSHTYGDGLGAGRGHQGQDLFAACGTPLKAAHSGTVEWKAFQSGGAGHYIVIDREGSPRDYVYMHMKKPGALVGQGAHVDTKQLIGYVGQSGNASGCHLHFELWDGWRDNLVNPTPRLRSWDSWS